MGRLASIWITVASSGSNIFKFLGQLTHCNRVMALTLKTKSDILIFS